MVSFRISISSSEKVRSGNSTTWPGSAREASVRSTRTGSPPSKRSSTSVIQRLMSEDRGWVRPTWSVVTGSSVVRRRYSPSTSLNAPTFQAVRGSPSTAKKARSPGV